MLGFLRRRRTAPDSLSQNIDDPNLRQQVISTVEQALAVLHTNSEGGLTSARLPWRDEDDVLAYKVVCTDGTDCMLAVEHPDLGPELFTTTRRHSEGIVRWTPGAGFTDPVAFLDWFKDHAGIA